MHDQSIMHFCAFTHRWQDNRITEKRIWEGRICQDCGNSQIPSYTTKDGGRAAQLSLSLIHPELWRYYPWMYHLLSLSLMQRRKYFSTWTACKTFAHKKIKKNIIKWKHKGKMKLYFHYGTKEMMQNHCTCKSYTLSICIRVCAPKYSTLAEHWPVWLPTKKMWADN